MKKLNRFIIIVAKIAEVFMWVGAAMSLIITVLSAIGKMDLIRFFTDSTLHALDASGNVVNGAFLLFFLTLALVLALMAMCARNVHLIFKTSAGETAFSRGATPFQPDNIRMVREIGIFMIAIPVVQLVMSIIAQIALGTDMVESSLNMFNVFIGLVVLALSQYFAYGMKLENDVDGLV